jgi:hypothetical protein
MAAVRALRPLVRASNLARPDFLAHLRGLRDVRDWDTLTATLKSWCVRRVPRRLWRQPTWRERVRARRCGDVHNLNGLQRAVDDAPRFFVSAG